MVYPFSQSELSPLEKMKLENQGLRQKVEALREELELARAREYAIWRKHHTCVAAHMLGVRRVHYSGRFLPRVSTVQEV